MGTSTLSSSSPSTLLHVLCFLLSGIAVATQPPPPQEFTLTVNTSGATCGEVAIISPEEYVGWGPELERVIPAGTTVELDWSSACPCPYRFVVWESNEPNLDGKTGRHNMSDQPIWQMGMDTVATAQFTENLPWVVDFNLDSASFGGDLQLSYTWFSSNGTLSSLSGDIIEIVAWDTSVTTEEAIAFLCSGRTTSAETVPPPPRGQELRCGRIASPS
jgi:hypothetical protein